MKSYWNADYKFSHANASTYGVHRDAQGKQHCTPEMLAWTAFTGDMNKGAIPCITGCLTGCRQYPLVTVTQKSGVSATYPQWAKLLPRNNYQCRWQIDEVSR